jgi:hypothetical protein
MADDDEPFDFDYDDDPGCSWCGGDGFDECYDPIQCCDPECDGEIGPCRACNGSGMSKDQVVW